MIAQSLAATIAANPECGVAMWGPRRLRDIPGFQSVTKRLDEEAEPIDKAAAIALDGLASFIARDVADERARGIKTLVLSEENFIGGMRNNFRTGTFYPAVARRLASFDSLLPMSPLRVAMGLRDYGSVWTSAYHYQPQSGRPVPVLEQARATMLDDKRGWPQVAEAARETWPDATLMMWRQEDLSAHSAEICSHIMGLPVGQIVMPEGKVNARKGKTARPDVFSTEELRHLNQRYIRHIRRMQAEHRDVWVGEGDA